MRGSGYTAEFDSIIFQVPVDTDIEVELRITFLSRQRVGLRVIAPDEFAGSSIGLPNIPYFGMPSIFGYYYAGRLTPKCTGYIIGFTREWYAKRHAVTERLTPIREYLSAGLSLTDVEEWIESVTGLNFRYEEFSRILDQILIQR
jgi:hypothetical protein